MKPIKRLIRYILYRASQPSPQDPLDELVRRGLAVGKNVHILNGVIIDPSHCWHIRIGDDVTLAPRVHILAHDASTKKILGFTKIGTITIGNRVFIGASTIVLPGVDIGNDVIVGAGSVVTHDIPDGVVAAGNPARVLGTIGEFVRRRRDELERFPSFGKEFTIEEGVTDEMKQEMRRKMGEGFGFVV